MVSKKIASWHFDISTGVSKSATGADFFRDKRLQRLSQESIDGNSRQFILQRQAFRLVFCMVIPKHMFSSLESIPRLEGNICRIQFWFPVKNIFSFKDFQDHQNERSWSTESGWWFGTFLFFHTVIDWECHHPNWRFVIFFRGVGLNHQPDIIIHHH